MLKIETIEGKHYIDAKVHLIATNNNAILLLGLSKEGKLIQYKDVNIKNDKYCQKQHLYITSSEQLSVGDLRIDSFRNTVGSVINDEELKYYNSCQNRFKKIIATTDQRLWQPDKDIPELGVLLPKLSDEFIQQYIKEYNKSSIITDVKVEFEFNAVKFMATSCTIKEKEYILYVDMQNTINILPKVEKLYTSDEIKKLFVNAAMINLFEGGWQTDISLKILDKYLLDNL